MMKNVLFGLFALVLVSSCGTDEFQRGKVRNGLFTSAEMKSLPGRWQDGENFRHQIFVSSNPTRLVYERFGEVQIDREEGVGVKRETWEEPALCRVRYTTPVVFVYEEDRLEFKEQGNTHRFEATVKEDSLELIADLETSGKCDDFLEQERARIAESGRLKLPFTLNQDGNLVMEGRIWSKLDQGKCSDLSGEYASATDIENNRVQVIEQVECDSLLISWREFETVDGKRQFVDRGGQGVIWTAEEVQSEQASGKSSISELTLFGIGAIENAVRTTDVVTREITEEFTRISLTETGGIVSQTLTVEGEKKTPGFIPEERYRQAPINDPLTEPAKTE